MPKRRTRNQFTSKSNFIVRNPDVRFVSKADIEARPRNVRFVPKAEITGIQDSTGKWVSNLLLISITFSPVKPPPAASSEIVLR